MYQVISRLVVMEVLNIGLKIPDIILPNIVMIIVFMTMKFLKCLWVMEDVYIVLLITSTFPLAIVDLSLEFT